MGLESVELLVEIENYFQIEITNVKVERLETVGDFQQCILEKLKQQKSINANSHISEGPKGKVSNVIKLYIEYEETANLLFFF